MDQWERIVSVEKDLIEANEELADENKNFFKNKGMRAILLETHFYIHMKCIPRSIRK